VSVAWAIRRLSLQSADPLIGYRSREPVHPFCCGGV